MESVSEKYIYVPGNLEICEQKLIDDKPPSKKELLTSQNFFERINKTEDCWFLE